MATAGAVRTKTQLIGASGDAGDLYDNSIKAIIALTARNLVETLFGKKAYRIVTADASIGYDDEVMYFNNTTAVVGTLPDITTARMAGRTFRAKRVNAGLVTIRSAAEDKVLSPFNIPVPVTGGMVTAISAGKVGDITISVVVFDPSPVSEMNHLYRVGYVNGAHTFTLISSTLITGAVRTDVQIYLDVDTIRFNYDNLSSDSVNIGVNAGSNVYWAIDEQPSVELAQKNQLIELQNNGTNWSVVGGAN